MNATRCNQDFLLLALLASLGFILVLAHAYEIHPVMAGDNEEFERVANSLKPGEELVLHEGVYSQTGRRAVTAKGTAVQPIVIRAAN